MIEQGGRDGLGCLRPGAVREARKMSALRRNGGSDGAMAVSLDAP